MVDQIKLWFRIVYETIQAAATALNELAHRLHKDAIDHEDPKNKDEYDPAHAERLRKEAKRVSQIAEDLKKATAEGVRNQPGDKGEEK